MNDAEFIEALAERLAEKIAERLQLPPGTHPEGGWVDKIGAAKILGISVATVERRTADGTLPSAKVGHLRRYRVDELRRLGGVE